MKRMSFWMSLVAVLCLTGCDLSTPVVSVDEPEHEVLPTVVETGESISFDDVIEYNDFVLDVLDACVNPYYEFLDTLDAFNESEDEETTDALVDSLDTSLVNALSACETSWDTLDRTVAYQGDASFQQSVQDVVENVYTSLELHDEFFFGEEFEGEEAYQTFLDLVDQYATEFDTLYDTVISTQEDYAQKFGYKLEE